MIMYDGLIVPTSLFLIVYVIVIIFPHVSYHFVYTDSRLRATLEYEVMTASSTSGSAVVVVAGLGVVVFDGADAAGTTVPFEGTTGTATTAEELSSEEKRLPIRSMTAPML